MLSGRSSPESSSSWWLSCSSSYESFSCRRIRRSIQIEEHRPTAAATTKLIGRQNRQWFGGFVDRHRPAFPLWLEVGAWGRARNGRRLQRYAKSSVLSFRCERAPKDPMGKENRACPVQTGSVWSGRARLHREVLSDRPSRRAGTRDK